MVTVEGRLEVSLFANLSLRWQGEVLTCHTPPRALPLLAYILIHRGQVLSRERLAALFWPDEYEQRALANLRRHIFYLTKTLPNGGEPWLKVTRRAVEWNVSSAYLLDIEEFLKASSDENRLDEAIALYTGDLLPSCDDEWAGFERERLRALQIGNLERAMARAQRAGDKTTFVQHALSLLKLDPYREDVVRELMSARVALGDRSGAIAEYERFAARLRDDLEIEPMPETVAATIAKAPVTVAIVDDEPLARNRIRAMLKAQFPELQVIGEYRHGKQALDGIRETCPSIAFLDVRMPNMDGFSVLEELSSNGSARPEVIFTTAYDAYAVRAFEVHAVDYLLKPFSDERFGEAVRRALHRVRQSGVRMLTGKKLAEPA